MALEFVAAVTWILFLLDAKDIGNALSDVRNRIWKCLQMDFVPLLPQGKLPLTSKLPVLNLFNQATTLKGLKSAGAKLSQDVIQCDKTMTVRVDDVTGEPVDCTRF